MARACRLLILSSIPVCAFTLTWFGHAFALSGSSCDKQQTDCYVAGNKDPVPPDYRSSRDVAEDAVEDSTKTHRALNSHHHVEAIVKDNSIASNGTVDNLTDIIDYDRSATVGDATDKDDLSIENKGSINELPDTGGLHFRVLISFSILMIGVLFLVRSFR